MLFLGDPTDTLLKSPLWPLLAGQQLMYFRSPGSLQPLERWALVFQPLCYPSHRQDTGCSSDDLAVLLIPLAELPLE